MLQFFLSSWRAGFRGRAFIAVFLVGVVLVGVAYLSASFSPRQPQTVALDVGLSGVRFALVLFVLTLVQELIGKEIERRTVVLGLSYPVPRGAYLAGRYLGVLALSAAATAILGLLLWLTVFVAAPNYDQQFRVVLGLPLGVVLFCVWVDAAVVGAFAVWVASVSTVSVLPLLAGLSFAILGRALGPVADFLASGADGQPDLAGRYGPLVGAIRWVLPDLSRLDVRAWVLYDLPPDSGSLLLALLMASGYGILMLAFAMRAFDRREFG